jgi:tRNA1Val (adenine37-N6)-methyltransferase
MMEALHDDELCELFAGRLRIFQKRNGYRFSVDSILLADFARQRASGSVADLGTGSGVLPIILSKSQAVKEIIGIEVQENLAQLAQKNICFNQCEDRVRIIHADIRTLRKDFKAGSFDAVISNPPFYPELSGRLNPDDQKAISRHELFGTLTDFINISHYLLKLSGKFLTIYPSARAVDLIAAMRASGIEPKTLQFIHPRSDEPANLLLIEGIKGAGKEAKILTPLVLYDARGSYTEQAQNIFAAI